MDDILKRKLLTHGVIIGGQVKGTAGSPVNNYVDLRTILGSPEFLPLMVNALGGLMFGTEATAIAGSGLAGYVLASHLGIRLHHDVTFIRDEPKTHGTKRQVEGYTPQAGDSILLVDDICNTGFSLRRDATYLKDNFGAIVTAAYVVVDRENLSEELPFPLHSIYTLDDLLNPL